MRYLARAVGLPGAECCQASAIVKQTRCRGDHASPEKHPSENRAAVGLAYTVYARRARKNSSVLTVEDFRIEFEGRLRESSEAEEKSTRNLQRKEWRVE